jgi:hypothetical protein
MSDVYMNDVYINNICMSDRIARVSGLTCGRSSYHQFISIFLDLVERKLAR